MRYTVQTSQQLVTRCCLREGLISETFLLYHIIISRVLTATKKISDEKSDIQIGKNKSVKDHIRMMLMRILTSIRVSQL